MLQPPVPDRSRYVLSHTSQLNGNYSKYVPPSPNLGPQMYIYKNPSTLRFGKLHVFPVLNELFSIARQNYVAREKRVPRQNRVADERLVFSSPLHCFNLKFYSNREAHRNPIAEKYEK